MRVLKEKDKNFQDCTASSLMPGGKEEAAKEPEVGTQRDGRETNQCGARSQARERKRSTVLRVVGGSRQVRTKRNGWT